MSWCWGYVGLEMWLKFLFYSICSQIIYTTEFSKFFFQVMAMFFYFFTVSQMTKSTSTELCSLQNFSQQKSSFKEQEHQMHHIACTKE